MDRPKLSEKQKEKAWSMLNNLNGEAERYRDHKGVFDNRDHKIAERLGVNVSLLRTYLATKTKEHLERLNKRKFKNIKTPKL